MINEKIYKLTLVCNQYETLLNTEHYDSISNMKFVVLQNLWHVIIT